MKKELNKEFNVIEFVSDALYSGLSALGLTPFAKEDSRSTVVIALNYLDGLEDKIFRDTLAKKFRILVAGGFW